MPLQCKRLEKNSSMPSLQRNNEWKNVRPPSLLASIRRTHSLCYIFLCAIYMALIFHRTAKYMEAVPLVTKWSWKSKRKITQWPLATDKLLAFAQTCPACIRKKKKNLPQSINHSISLMVRQAKKHLKPTVFSSFSVLPNANFQWTVNPNA